MAITLLPKNGKSVKISYVGTSKAIYDQADSITVSKPCIIVIHKNDYCSFSFSASNNLTCIGYCGFTSDTSWTGEEWTYYYTGKTPLTITVRGAGSAGNNAEKVAFCTVIAI